MEVFSECVSNLFLLLQDESSETLAANVILPLLERLANAAADAEAVAETPSHRSAINEMHCHGLQRVTSVLLQQCERLFRTVESKDDEVQQDETQRIAAQSTELTLQILHILAAVENRMGNDASSTVTESIDKLIQDYGNFQKETLRSRCKPPIATLVKERRTGTFRRDKGSTLAPLAGNGLVISTEDDGDEEEQQQHHAAAVVSILQHSIRLVHPLLVWQSGIQVEGSHMGASIFSLCETANTTLFQQTQDFIHTIVGEWFFDDLQIKEQMENMNTQSAETTLVDAHFDASVSELASICHMLSDFSLSAGRQSEYPSQWTEWKLHCGVLQRHWLLSHYHAVRQKAVPMTVVTDTDVRSSSLVEDAALLSTVALEKSVDVAEIANNLCQSIWGLEDEASVFSALCQRVGCLGRMMPSATSPATAASSRPDTTKSPPKSGNFAVALLEAMDGETENVPHAPPTTFLSNLLEQDAVRQYEFDTSCCLWNSFFAASKAIQSIRELLPDDDGSMDRQTSSMLALVRAEMTSFEARYNQELEANVHAAVVSDAAWEKLRAFLQAENYLIHSEAELATAEAEERLDRDFLSPLRKSMLLEQAPKKCDDGVQTIVWKVMMAESSRLLISTIENLAPNSMTDWGALLFSQQARLLHGAIPSDSVVPEDDTLPQILAVLQLERPADWLAYCSTSCLDAKTVRQTMIVRAGFTDVVVDSIITSAYGDDKNIG